MPRILVICDETKELSWLWEAPSLQSCVIETVGEEADVLQLLRRRDFDIVVTSIAAPRKSDFAHLSEILRIRPGLRLILLAPETTSNDLIAALRAHVFACFRDPGPCFNRERLPHAPGSNTIENPIAHIEYREAHGMRPGGFGIMLTKQLVDEVIYNEIGNEVLLIKHTC